MSEIIKTLEADLQAVIYRHGHITGREFQAACLRMAEGLYATDDLDCYHRPNDLAEAVGRELTRIMEADAREVEAIRG